MKRILIAVDDTKGSKAAFGFCTGVCGCMRPEKIVLLYVERFEGRSLMTEMLSDSELSTLKDVLQGTAYKEALDKKADDILAYYKKQLEGSGLSAGVKTVRKIGNAAEEILKTAREEEAEMIIIGSRGNRVGHLFMGSVSREVANSSDIPVLIVK
jgi:nucleotide-binding universal stress UspA family protein